MNPPSRPIPRLKPLSYVVWLLAIPAGAQAPAVPERDPAVAVPAIGIDHIPLAVRDLDAAAFFQGTNRSPTDRPEHFAHLNTANATIAVWIAGGDQTRMLSVFRSLGARIDHKRVNAPGMWLEFREQRR